MAYKRVPYRYLVFNSLEALQSVFSDTDISQETIIWWVKIIVNKVKAKQIPTNPTGSYLATFTDLPTQMQFDGSNNILRNRKYVELPANIFDLERDQGVNWLSYATTTLDDRGKIIFCEPIYFQQSTLIQLREMAYNPHEKPSRTQPYFVRVDSRLYLAGVEELSQFKLDGAFYITENPIIGSMSLDDTILLNDEQIADVLAQILALGKFALAVPQGSVEDGSDLRNPQISKTAAIGQRPQIEEQQ